MAITKDQAVSQSMQTVAFVTEKIQEGRVLLLAGDEAQLARLPPGKWIGGTAANFMTAEGGVTDLAGIFTTDVTEYASNVEVCSYSQNEIATIGSHYPANGFTVLIVPGLTDIHGKFARDVQDYPGVFNAPLVGWISGVQVDEIGRRQPKVFCGSNFGSTDSAVAMHISLPDQLMASLDIINLFHQGSDEIIQFDSMGFETTGDCHIGEKTASLAAYIREKNIDTKLPLVANYHGAMINVSIQNVDDQSGKVNFYAPVFPGIKYRFADRVPDYTDSFNAVVNYASGIESVAFSCNCILNYMYAELEGKRTGSLVGPITFGEIAYILLNQTLVYLSIEKA